MVALYSTTQDSRRKEKLDEQMLFLEKFMFLLFLWQPLTTDKDSYIERLCTGRNKQKNISNLKRKQLLQGINKMIENSLETKRKT